MSLYTLMVACTDILTSYFLVKALNKKEKRECKLGETTAYHTYLLQLSFFIFSTAGVSSLTFRLCRVIRITQNLTVITIFALK